MPDPPVDRSGVVPVESYASANLWEAKKSGSRRDGFSRRI